MYVWHSYLCVNEAEYMKGSVGLSSTTNPKPRGETIPKPAQANLCQPMYIFRFLNCKYMYLLIANCEFFLCNRLANINVCGGFARLTKSCSHFLRYYWPVLISKAGCKGNNGKNWLLSPVTSSQSEGYSSKWLIWLMCREPLICIHCNMVQGQPSQLLDSQLDLTCKH